IAVGVLGLGPGRGRDEGDLLAVGRPGEPLAVGRQRMVGAFSLREEHGARPVRLRDDDAGAGVLAAEVGDLPAVARPARTGGALAIRSEAHRLAAGDVHDPDLRVGPAYAIAVLHAVRDMGAVG